MVVFVIAEDAPYILLCRDHPCVRSWICRNPTARPQADPLHTPLAAITRVQSQVLAEGGIANAFAHQRNGAEAKPIELPKPKREESERPKPGPVVADTQLPDLEVELADLPEEASPSTCTPGEEVTSAEDSASGEGEEDDDSALEEEGRFSGGLEGECSNDHPLLTLGKGKEKVNMMIAQQKADDSLLEVRKNAESCRDGYLYEEGVLTHIKLAEPGREWTRVVVPFCRIREVLDVGHRGLIGGHFSHNKMADSLSQHFTWPGIRKDIRAYRSACAERQKAGRLLKPKVPMVQTPTISVPYQRMAWDLVGPLNSTVKGYRYISTVMCLGTRYPYAVALKKIDALSVAEGLMEVIQHTGIPNELLSDQGSLLMGRVVNKTCELLNIKKLKTTAYHPQTNGALERWHATLKGMLRKFDDSSETWDKLLKYCLLVCRAMPHAASGFSPYELVHGRSMRDPLEAMKLGWVKGDLCYATSSQWVTELRETLAKLHKVAQANEEAYKLKSKAAYDMSTKPRSFE